MLNADDGFKNARQLAADKFVTLGVFRDQAEFYVNRGVANWAIPSLDKGSGRHKTGIFGPMLESPPS